jgi:murein DD-endopeptidase MepM/ murein hydrolase activator NlpD
MRFLRRLFWAVSWTALLGIVLPWAEKLRYAAYLAALPPPVELPLPVAGARIRAVRDTWHSSRPGGRRHEGTDIFARKGTPVLSTTDGMLLQFGENRLGGKTVWVLGPAGQRHYYAHLDAYALLSAGERIAPGTVLGYVGTTGNAAGTPPHLHYGIYTLKGPVNPYPLLRR